MLMRYIYNITAVLGSFGRISPIRKTSLNSCYILYIYLISMIYNIHAYICIMGSHNFKGTTSSVFGIHCLNCTAIYNPAKERIFGT